MVASCNHLTRREEKQHQANKAPPHGQKSRGTIHPHTDEKARAQDAHLNQAAQGFIIERCGSLCVLFNELDDAALLDLCAHAYMRTQAHGHTEAAGHREPKKHGNSIRQRLSNGAGCSCGWTLKPVPDGQVSSRCTDSAATCADSFLLRARRHTYTPCAGGSAVRAVALLLRGSPGLARLQYRGASLVSMYTKVKTSAARRSWDRLRWGCRQAKGRCADTAAERRWPRPRVLSRSIGERTVQMHCPQQVSGHGRASAVQI